MPGGIISQRRLGIAELVGYAFSLLWKNLPIAAAICAMLWMPMLLWAIFAGEALVALSERAVLAVAAGEQLTAAETAYLMRIVYAGIGVIIIFEPLLQGALSYVAQKGSEGVKADFGGALDCSIGKWWKLVLTKLLNQVFFFGLISFLPVPFIIGTLFMFTETVTALTGKFWFNAHRESVAAVKGRFIRSFGILALVMAIKYAIMFALWFAFLLTASAIGGVAIIFAGAIIWYAVLLAGSFAFIATALYYLNITQFIKPESEKEENSEPV